jgi:hypothetical protein
LRAAVDRLFRFLEAEAGDLAQQLDGIDVAAGSHQLADLIERFIHLRL